jgi:hypothetical protein
MGEGLFINLSTMFNRLVFRDVEVLKRLRQ